jgi:hypothetical protein
MVVGQEIEQECRGRLVTAEVGDQNGGVEQVEAQAVDSVRRVPFTQVDAARRSRQCA